MKRDDMIGNQFAKAFPANGRCVHAGPRLYLCASACISASLGRAEDHIHTVPTVWL